MKRILEIKGTEGGIDAKLFAKDLAKAYICLADRLSWKANVLSSTEHLIKIEIVGNNLDQLDQEAGGHRVQRVPPTERKGRVHTSSITVAVIDPNTPTDKRYTLTDDKHFTIEWFSGTGKGGQHRNKKKNSCRVIHKPTGISEARQGRKRVSNLRDAKRALLVRLRNSGTDFSHNQIAHIRRNQVGSGMRGDKIRTYRFQDNKVHDHQSGLTTTCSKILKGHFDLLWR